MWIKNFELKTLGISQDLVIIILDQKQRDFGITRYLYKRKKKLRHDRILTYVVYFMIIVFCYQVKTPNSFRNLNSKPLIQ